MWDTPTIVLITGIMAAGKSTVAEELARRLADTPRIGLWLDTSEQTPAQTVDEILGRAWTEGRIG